MILCGRCVLLLLLPLPPQFPSSFDFRRVEGMQLSLLSNHLPPVIPGYPHILRLISTDTRLAICLLSQSFHDTILATFPNK